ncbi:MAG: DUF2625 family protein [Kofleriaceae bacterium]|nr:DUF2625 family protein [Kofleriaceae bacterium]
MSKPWTELVSADDDAIDQLREWCEASGAQILPAEPTDGQRVLGWLQVTTRSPLGAVALHTGGLLVDGGWLRVLGAGSAALPRALDRWNQVEGGRRCDLGLLVADDVLGGCFVWAETTRTIHYLAPDTLQWEDLELGYGDWLAGCLGDGLAAFYQDLRWPTWQQDIAPVGGDRGLSVMPPLWAGATGARSYRAVPMTELWSLAMEIGPQLAELPDGAQVELVVKE